MARSILKAKWSIAATVSDTEDISGDIAFSWESSIDGEFSTQGAIPTETSASQAAVQCRYPQHDRHRHETPQDDRFCLILCIRLMSP